jgi:hypothetical protein
MRNLVTLFLFLIALAGQLVQARETKRSPQSQLAGSYYLTGHSEVGSELVLDKSGRFRWELAYGAIDQFAQGTWQARGGKVVLTPDAGQPGQFRPFTGDEMNIRKAPRYGTWVAIVGVPGRGPVPGIEVRFESASGQFASAVSDRNGDAIVEMRSSEAWTRTGLRRAGSRDQWVWFDAPEERSLARIDAFVVMNPADVLRPPFKSLTLVVRRNALEIVDPAAGFTGTYKK